MSLYLPLKPPTDSSPHQLRCHFFTTTIRLAPDLVRIIPTETQFPRTVLQVWVGLFQSWRTSLWMARLPLGFF